MQTGRDRSVHVIIIMYYYYITSRPFSIPGLGCGSPYIYIIYRQWAKWRTRTCRKTTSRLASPRAGVFYSVYYVILFRVYVCVCIYIYIRTHVHVSVCRASRAREENCSWNDSICSRRSLRPPSAPV